MTQDEKLLAAWNQLLKTLTEKQGLSRKQAVLHVKKHFPELYDLYEKAKRHTEQQGSSSPDSKP
jgi:hypothetical protein